MFCMVCINLEGGHPILPQKIADAIVRETSLRISRNVNIMDMKGRIISTMDKSRLDSYHAGALEVLEKGEGLIIHPEDTEKWRGTMPGINLPIVFQEKVIGVIGVTGDPRQMGDIGELVKMTTELMIRQEFLASQSEKTQQTKEAVIGQLLTEQPKAAELDRELQSLGIDWKPPFHAILIEVNEKTIHKQAFLQGLDDCIGRSHAVAGFLSLNKLFIAVTGLDGDMLDRRLERLRQLIDSWQLNARVSYSLPFDTVEEFRQSYQDCRFALQIANPEEMMVSFSQIEVKALIHQIDPAISERFSNRIIGEMDYQLQETLHEFFRQGLNIQKTAESMFLHRNTLLYRLRKITSMTGFDPKQFDDALVIQIALWVHGRKAGN